jgi:hypothetical protein
MNKRAKYIAGRKTSEDWKKFRIKLTKEFKNNLWEQAFNEYFLERVKLRYFNPIKELKKNDTFKGEGFLIMAILCTLVEFFETTLRGIKYKSVRNKRDLDQFEYCVSIDIFVNFLSNRIPFSNHFDKDLAFEFYKSIRCGLLHEAQTKNGWTIKARSSNGNLIDKEEKIVFRDNFQEAFKEFINNYHKDLLVDNELQKAFIRKFDFICEET